MLLDQAALALSSVKGRKVPEATELSDHGSTSELRRPRAMLQSCTWPCSVTLPSLHRLHCSQQAGSVQREESSRSQEVLHAPSDNDLTKQTLPLTHCSERNHTLGDPTLPTQSCLKIWRKGLQGPQLLEDSKTKFKIKKKAYWLCTIKIKSIFQCQTRF